MCTPAIPALGRLRQEDCKLKAKLDYRGETLPQNNNNKTKNLSPSACKDFCNQHIWFWNLNIYNSY
jgi:hypothetical protein